MMLRRRPPPEALRWVEAVLGPGATVTSVRRLRAGTSAAVHLLRVEAGDEARSYVLRRFVRADWLAREPDLAIREARILRSLEGSAVPTPRVVGIDEHGTRTDVPAVLMERLPGSLDLAPDDLEAYVERAIAPLAQIEATPPHEGAHGYYPFYLGAGYGAGDGREPPSWTRDPALWRTAFQIARRPWPAATRVLVHRDYHPGNLLWSRGRLTGVTDWLESCVGPAGMDLAHFKSNAIGLWGIEAASTIEAAADRLGVSHGPFWDLLGAIDGSPTGPNPAQWADAGRDDLTTEELRGRLDGYVARCVERACAEIRSGV